MKAVELAQGLQLSADVSIITVMISDDPVAAGEHTTGLADELDKAKARITKL